MALDDDLDWLYHRGKYTDGSSAPAPMATPQPAAAPRPSVSPRPPQAPHLRPQARPHPKKLTPGKIVGRTLLTLSVLVVVFAVYLIAVPMMALADVKRVDAAPAGDRPAKQPGKLFVLAGSDSREGLTAAEQEKLSTGNDEGKRSDVLMLLYIPPKGKAALISVPRDSYVTIPGRKNKDKINTAYSIGGPKLTVATVEANTGLRVDGYAEVGFAGFVHMVDAVGGVTLCPKKAYDDEASGLHVKAGCQEFDGVKGLAYARMRHLDPLQDLGRIQRQRELISALAKKAATPQTVLLPPRYWGVTHGAAESFILGKDVGNAELFGLANGVLKMGSDEGLNMTVPVADNSKKTPVGSVVIWDEAASKEMFTAIRRGDTAALAKFGK